MDERPPEGHSWLLVRLLSAPHHARLCLALASLQFLLLSSDAILSLWELNNSWAWRPTACFGSFGSSCEWNTAERKPGQAACCPFTQKMLVTLEMGFSTDIAIENSAFTVQTDIMRTTWYLPDTATKLQMITLHFVFIRFTICACTVNEIILSHELMLFSIDNTLRKT